MARQARADRIGSWAESQEWVPGAGKFGDRLGLDDQERHLAAARQMIIVDLLQKVCAFYDSTPASFLKQSLEYIRNGILQPEWQTLLQNPDWQQFGAAPQSQARTHGPLNGVPAFNAHSPFSELVNARPVSRTPVEVVKSTLPRHSPYIGFHRHSPSCGFFGQKSRDCAEKSYVRKTSANPSRFDRFLDPNDAAESPEDRKALTKANNRTLQKSNSINTFVRPTSPMASFSCTERRIVPSHGCSDNLAAASSTDAVMGPLLGPLLAGPLNGLTSRLGLVRSHISPASDGESDGVHAGRREAKNQQRPMNEIAPSPSFEIQRSSSLRVERRRSLQAEPDFPAGSPLPFVSACGQSISRNLSIFERDFIYIRTLGKGAFGVVYEVQNKLDLKKYAMKVVMFNTRDTDVKNKALREVQSWSLARHPHVCRYSHAWVESGWAMRYPFFSSEDADAPFSLHGNGHPEPLSPPIEDSPGFTESNPASVNCSAQSNCFPEETWVDSVDSNDNVIFEDSNPESEKETSQTKSVTFNRSRKSRGVRSSKSLSFPQTLFIQMELCDNTLEQWVRTESEMRVSPDNLCKKKMARQVTTALTIFGQLLSALDHIHGMELVHRDVKPSNIYRATEGCWVLGDFGLSKSIHQSTSGEVAQWASMDSGAVGTMAYSSPEQMNGCDVDASADMFSSGLVLIELMLLFSTMHERAQAFCSLRIGRKVPDTMCMRYFPKIAELILALTSPNSADRPTAESLLDGRSVWRYEVTQELKKFCVDVDVAAQDVWCISTPMFRPSSPPLLPLNDDGFPPLDPVSEQACQTECNLVECAVQTD
eukprot:GEMP01013010.1.p1 GENE.GEMP01013010.1~~GEMP01013010.1.p1  ORF type:complete len:820 (+),score=160.08 GEMP01013010.1:57-2516(+)